MRQKTKLSNQQGFTIVELMIATVVFSIVLLLCSMAIIHVGRMYYKGMITNRTQDVSRKVIDDIVSTIQIGSGNPSTFVTRHDAGDGRFAYCIGSVRYTFDVQRALGAETDAKHILWKDRIETGACEAVDLTLDQPSTSGIEMLGKNMRLPVLDISSSDNRTWRVTARVSYGDDSELFETGSNFGMCKGVNAGGQFCAVSEFSTAVTRRVL